MSKQDKKPEGKPPWNFGPPLSSTEADEVNFAYAAAFPAKKRTEYDRATLSSQNDKIRRPVRKHHPDYAAIKFAVDSQRLPTSELPALTIDWIAIAYKFEPAFVLQRLVAVFNKYGADYTATIFGFGKGHLFDWLPETGELKPLPAERLGKVYVNKDRFQTKVRDEIKTETKDRRIRKVPADFEFTRLAGNLTPTPSNPQDETWEILSKTSIEL